MHKRQLIIRGGVAPWASAGSRGGVYQKQYDIKPKYALFSIVTGGPPRKVQRATRPGVWGGVIELGRVGLPLPASKTGDGKA